MSSSVVLPPHLLDDPAGLAEALRLAERQHEHERAVAACEALARLETWGPILRFATNAVARSQPRERDAPIVGTPPPWSPHEFHEMTGDARLARHGYNAARVLAPMSGQLLPPEPGAEPERVPNPMRLCVRALTSWYPGGWLPLLRELIDCDSMWRTDLGTALEFGDGPTHHVVPINGRMICAERAPTLAWLPECVCLRNEGRRGVCPHCQGKPARPGEMCVCVAGRCPRCLNGPKFTRDNKAIVLSAYGLRDEE